MGRSRNVPQSRQAMRPPYKRPGSISDFRASFGAVTTCRATAPVAERPAIPADEAPERCNPDTINLNRAFVICDREGIHLYQHFD